MKKTLNYLITHFQKGPMNSQTVYEIKKSQYSKEEILRKKLFHVFVCGLPRSGTSMMMHICELLGVKMFHTTEDNKEKMNKRYEKQFGKDYHPNQSGFFEIGKNVLGQYFDIASTPYSGCKMIIPVAGVQFSLIKTIPSKVIFMWRDPEEIRQSQNAFYSDGAEIAFIRMHLANQKTWFENQKIDFRIINYRDVVKNPSEKVQEVKDYILSDKTIEEAVQYVNPDAYRFDKDKIVVGL